MPKRTEIIFHNGVCRWLALHGPGCRDGRDGDREGKEENALPAAHGRPGRVAQAAFVGVPAEFVLQLGEAVLCHLGFDASAVAGVLVLYKHTYRCIFSLQIYHDQKYFDKEDNSLDVNGFDTVGFDCTCIFFFAR